MLFVRAGHTDNIDQVLHQFGAQRDQLETGPHGFQIGLLQHRLNLSTQQHRFRRVAAEHARSQLQFMLPAWRVHHEFSA